MSELREMRRSIQQQSTIQIDEYGFEPQVFNTDDIFSKLRPYEASGVPLEQEKIKLLALSEKQIVIVTDQDKVFRIRECLDEIVFSQFDVPERRVESTNVGKKILSLVGQNTRISIDKIFLDPIGYHCILSSEQGFSFYLNYESSKIRVLKNLRGPNFIIKSIGFDETGISNSTTKNMILGTNEGWLLLYRIENKQGEMVETYPEQLIQLKGGKPILQLIYLLIQNSQSEEKTILILASTSTSIISFYGQDLSQIFAPNKNQDSIQDSCLEFPPLALTALMSVCYDSSQGQKKPHSFIWTNGGALLHYKIPEANYKQKYLQDILYYKYAKMEEQEQYEYKIGEMPIELLLTEFHYFILHSDSLTIMSRISEKIVEKYDLSQMGIVYGMCYDYQNKKIYLYSSKQINTLNIYNEHKDAWRLFLLKKDIKQAFYTSQRYQQDATEYLCGLYADQLFESGKYKEAAQQFYLTTRSFEEITLKFLNTQIKGDLKAVDGLEVYLHLWLDNLKKDTPTQRMIIIGWLMEIKIAKQNSVQQQVTHSRLSIGGASLKEEMQRKQDFNESEKVQFNQEYSLKELLIGPCNNLQDQKCQSLIFQIMQSHGRLKECISFAKQRDKYKMIIQHHINECEDNKALQVLKYLKQVQQQLKCILKFGLVLLQKCTSDTIEVMKSLAPYLLKNDFKTEKLIINIMNIPHQFRSEAIQLVETLLTQQPQEKNKESDYKMKQKQLNNIYVYLLAKSNNPNKLTNYLKSQNMSNSFDIDLALRLICSSQQLKEPQIQIYLMMNLITPAIKLALSEGLVDIAIDLAKNHTNKAQEKKKLWLQIARYLLDKGGKNIEEVKRIIDSDEGYVKIEDVLLSVKSDITINDFQDQICNSLEKYNSEICSLKESQNGFSESADKLKNDLRMVKQRYIEISPNHNCSECLKNLFQQSFYIFPCLHGFHKVCLIQKMKKQGLEEYKLEEIQHRNSELEALQIKQMKMEMRRRQQYGSGFLSNLIQLFGQNDNISSIDSDKKRVNANEDNEAANYQYNFMEVEKQLQVLKLELDQMIGSECIYCGPGIVENILRRYEMDNTDGGVDWNTQ